MKVVGIVLVVLGILGLASGGFSWTHNKTVVDAGPIELKAKEHKRVSIPPLAGGLILVAGVALLIKAGK